MMTLNGYQSWRQPVSLEDNLNTDCGQFILIGVPSHSSLPHLCHNTVDCSYEAV